MTDSPPPKRRGWIEALVATALRWNDRLGRPVGDDEPIDVARPSVGPTVRTPARRLRSSNRPSPEAGPRRT